MKITSYEIISHGCMHSDYFQGCGVSYTDFEHVQTGIGASEKEAFEDALGLIALDGTEISAELESEGESARTDTEECEDNESYFHVSIRYNIQ